MTIKELAELYMAEAKESVEVKKCFPQNIYAFTTKNFRPIKGWDEEWYDVMHGWTEVLQKQGWSIRWADPKAGESQFFNFQYCYNEDPIKLGVSLPDLNGMSKENWDKLKRISALDGSVNCQAVF